MMSEKMNVLHKQAMDMLTATSRTFVIPISHLPSGLQEAVTSAYLCMRAIDEIEDHPQLPLQEKVNLLQAVSTTLHKPVSEHNWEDVFQAHTTQLPEVTRRIGDWITLCPQPARPYVLASTSEMAEGMAQWVKKEWRIQTEEDLDQYTFYVAGLVGTLLSELWKWYEDIDTDHELAVAFGRGLQAVNIIRNRTEDLSRGVDFYPDGWEDSDLFHYARRHLSLADEYTASLKPGPILDFCKIPLILAYGTLEAIESGRNKLSRADVKELVSQVRGK